MRPKNLGRDDVDHLRRRVVRSPERNGRIFAIHNTFAWIAHDELAGIAETTIHRLGAAGACRHNRPGGHDRAAQQRIQTGQIMVPADS